VHIDVEKVKTDLGREWSCNLGFEIERKFLVDRNKLPDLGQGVYISQGYIETIDKTAVRVRIKGDKGFITLKGENIGMSRLEFEYEISITEAREIISKLCAGKSIDKTRYEFRVINHIWEIDFFMVKIKGLFWLRLNCQTKLSN